jgi:hypothetical protein
MLVGADLTDLIEMDALKWDAELATVPAFKCVLHWPVRHTQHI